MATWLDALESAAQEGCAFVMLSKGYFTLIDEGDLDAPQCSDVDHRNRNGLDNRRQNLRLCNPEQNLGNARKHRRTGLYSKYKGVGRYLPHLNRPKSWIARGMVRRKTVHLGYFKTEIEAARAYNEWAKVRFGEFALLNNI